MTLYHVVTLSTTYLINKDGFKGASSKIMLKIFHKKKPDNYRRQIHIEMLLVTITWHRNGVDNWVLLIGYGWDPAHF